MTGESDPAKRFAVGRRDTPQRVQTLRQARRSFFLQLDTLVPEVIAELRSLPIRAHEGEIVNTSEARLPRVNSGRWIDLRDLILPPAVAQKLHALADRQGQLPVGWSASDIELYRSEAEHLFVPKTVIDWAARCRLDSQFNWVAAFGTLVRTRWRGQPEQPIAEVLNTLHGFPILHPFDAVWVLRSGVEELPGYPTLSPADPKAESQAPAMTGLAVIARYLSPADPRAESQAQFVKRAKAHYRDASKYLNRYLKSVHESDLARDSAWLVRVQVLGHTTTAIANDAKRMSRQAVDLAIRHFAELIGVPLTQKRRSGRPLGRKDSESVQRRRTRH